jgi:hypothetical protein
MGDVPQVDKKQLTCSKRLLAHKFGGGLSEQKTRQRCCNLGVARKASDGGSVKQKPMLSYYSQIQGSQFTDSSQVNFGGRMKPAIIALMLFAASLGAQDKPVRIDRAKMTERMKQVEGEIQKRQKELLQADTKLAELIGLYNGLATALGDTTLAPTDSTKIKKVSK